MIGIFISLDGDPAKIRNFGQILRIVAETARAEKKRIRSALVVVEPYLNLYDRHLTAIVLTLSWTRIAAEA